MFLCLFRPVFLINGRLPDPLIKDEKMKKLPLPYPGRFSVIEHARMTISMTFIPSSNIIKIDVNRVVTSCITD